jgi:hypothetical protein
MLEEIYFREEILTEDEYYDALLFVFGDAYPELSEEEIEDMLEDILDQLPAQYAEGVFDTISNVGKKIGSGALKFAGDHPDLIKTAATLSGTAIGGPIGAGIGSGVGNLIVQGTQKNVLPAAGKTLAIMQNPQAQSAIARATIGIGNGTAPLILNGKTNQVPVATVLRAIIDSAQKALMELDNQKIVPDGSFSESLPYSEDVDMQAEWLAEQLIR